MKFKTQVQLRQEFVPGSKVRGSISSRSLIKKAAIICSITSSCTRCQAAKQR